MFYHINYLFYIYYIPTEYARNKKVVYTIYITFMKNKLHTLHKKLTKLIIIVIIKIKSDDFDSYLNMYIEVRRPEK